MPASVDAVTCRTRSWPGATVTGEDEILHLEPISFRCRSAEQRHVLLSFVVVVAPLSPTISLLPLPSPLSHPLSLFPLTISAPLLTSLLRFHLLGPVHVILSHCSRNLSSAVVVRMAGMKPVSILLGLCLLVGVVHCVSMDQLDDTWRFSAEGNNPGDQQGGHLVPNGYHYDFDATGVTGNPNQFSEDTLADMPGQFDPSSQGSSFGDEGYVFDARSQDNAAPYDYSNYQFSTQQDEPPSTPYALGVPEQRDARPDYVYYASAGDGASFSTHGTQGTPGDEAVTASDADSFSTLDTQPGNDQPVNSTGHQGPVSFYTPASDADGAFQFYDARSDEEKNATSTLDEDPASGAESFSQNHDASGDTTVASTSPILATTKPTQGIHGCSSSYWAQHVKQWPKEMNMTTRVCQAFGGVNLRKNLEIIYGSTTVFQALLDTRANPYSKLLSNAVAALLNAYAKPAFPLKPAEVSKLFHAALASKTAAAAQAQKFENENHAFGDSDCK